jgi:hypothetical protein
MTVTRFAISLDEELAKKVREAAGEEPISTWLAEAAERRLRAEGLLAVIAKWEEEHGEITDSEMRAVERAARPRTRRTRR